MKNLTFDKKWANQNCSKNLFLNVITTQKVYFLIFETFTRS